MSQAANPAVTLKVHLAGAIAYVPENNSMWALLPSALAPVRTGWPTMQGILDARSPHMALLIVEDEVFNRYDSSGRAFAVYKPDHPDVVKPGSLFPITPSQKAAIELTGYELDFGLTDTNIEIDCSLDFVPSMKEISKSHRFVDHRIHPHNANLDRQNPPISAALRMNTGRLSVASFFPDRDGKPAVVDFGFVRKKKGNPEFSSRVWGKKIANHLIWTLTYPANQREVKITASSFSGQPEIDFRLKVPDSREVEIAILHSEPEIPFFFVGDPKAPSDINRFPDPDFEIFYTIATKKTGRRRVPVPSAIQPGATEKPCVGGRYEGFK